MLPASALARLLARQRAQLLASAAQLCSCPQHHHHATIHTSAASASPPAEYAPSAVGGPGASADAAASGAAAAAPSSPVKMRATTILSVRLGGEVVLIGDGQATANDFVVKPNVRKLRMLGPAASAAAAANADDATADRKKDDDCSSSGKPPAAPPRLSETAAASSPVVAGFAGLAADGLALLDRLDAQIHAHPGQLRRAAVELALAWRQDRALRELDAAVLVADGGPEGTTLWLSGNGDVLESSDGVVAVGSGSDFAEAAARALVDAAADANAAAADVAAAGNGRRRPLAARLTALDVAKRAMRIAADSCVYTNHRWTWCRLRPVAEEGEGTAEGAAAAAEEAQQGGAAASDKSGGKSKRSTPARIAVDEGSEDGLLTTRGSPMDEPTHGGER